MVRILQRAVDGLGAALLTAIAALAFFQVLARYVLGLSTPWSEELLRLLFVWLVLLGACRAAHMRIDLLEITLDRSHRKILAAVQTLVGAALLLLLITHGMTLVELTAYDRYTALPVSVQWLYWSLIAGGSLWLLFMTVDLIRKLRDSA